MSHDGRYGKNICYKEVATHSGAATTAKAQAVISVARRCASCRAAVSQNASSKHAIVTYISRVTKSNKLQSICLWDALSVGPDGPVGAALRRRLRQSKGIPTVEPAWAACQRRLASASSTMVSMPVHRANSMLHIPASTSSPGPCRRLPTPKGRCRPSPMTPRTSWRCRTAS